MPYVSNLPSTPDLINGAAASLEAARSVEISGTYVYEGLTYGLDEQMVPPFEGHFVATAGASEDEVIQYADRIYYRGYDLVANALASDPNEDKYRKGLGARWFVDGKATSPVDATWVMSLQSFRATFLNTLLMQRRDHVTAGGVDAAELSTSNYTLVITEASPHRLLLMKSKPGKLFNNTSDLVLAFTNYNEAFDIVEPTDFVDLNDKNTWPPLYQTVSVTGNRCADPCVITAVYQNYGGLRPDGAPSTVSFTISTRDDESGNLGKCTVTIQPDVPNGKRLTERCGMTSAAWKRFSGTYYYYAAVHNPAYE